MNKIAIIIPRFHPEVSGGAEKLAFDYAELLKAKYQIEVFTSCSKDYISWKNELPPGTSEWEGLTLHRFLVIKERKINKMNVILDKLISLGEKRNPKLEKTFLEEQGPLVPNLCDSFLQVESEFLITFLVGYLYYPVVQLIPKLKGKWAIIPTFHDEPVFHLPMYQEIFKEHFFYSFNAPEEKELIQKSLGKQLSRSRVIGTFVTPSESKQTPQSFPAFSPQKKEKPFSILTLGRIDMAKGFDHFFSFLDSFQEKYPEIAFTLTCIGSLHLDRKHIPSYVHLTGFISEEDKRSLLSEADLVINPSPFESFSIATMESWLQEKPVLVNGRSQVMKGHCLRSKGGLFYSDSLDFVEILLFFYNNQKLSQRMGQNGKKYVQLNFSKERIASKLQELINACTTE